MPTGTVTYYALALAGAVRTAPTVRWAPAPCDAADCPVEGTRDGVLLALQPGPLLVRVALCARHLAGLPVAETIGGPPVPP